MAPHTLSAKHGVLLIIDPQEKLLPKIFQSGRVEKNIILLLRFAKIAGLAVIATTQYEKGVGPIVEPIRTELPDAPILDKIEFGCFENPAFVQTMEKKGGTDNTLILSGIESHICVAQTALGALQRGYRVHIASDAVSSRTEGNWKLGLRRMQQEGAVISSTEMVIFDMLKRSDSPYFKAILPDLKVPII